MPWRYDIVFVAVEEEEEAKLLQELQDVSVADEIDENEDVLEEAIEDGTNEEVLLLES